MIITDMVESSVDQLVFGTESNAKADLVLQNNLELFEWAVRNKRYPAFWGRSLTGENRLTRKEIEFLHVRGCRIAAFCSDLNEKNSYEQGYAFAKNVAEIAYELGIPERVSIFAEFPAEELATTAYLQGYAHALLQEGYTPGFKANTDAVYPFDREFSRGMQIDPETFGKCAVWAVAPSLAEYDRITTSHLIHPDNWAPFAPSGIKRNAIAVWQYGKNCHPIDDSVGRETVFHVNLVRNRQVIYNQMF